MSDTQPDLTVEQAREQLNCSVPTIYSLMKKGRLSFYKLGRATRIKFESIQALRNSGTLDDLKEGVK